MSPTSSLDVSRVLGANAPAPPGLPSGIVLYNVDADGSLEQVSGLAALKPDLFVTVDISPVVNMALAGKITDTTRNNLIEFLIYLSDRNADIWESRIFALYKLRTGIVGATRDIATAGAGASSLIVPPVAAGLSAFNLFAGSFSDQLDTTLYSKETVEAVLKAITAARRTFKNTIRSNLKQSIDKYDMFYALDQIRHYDSLVSVRKGLAYINNLTDSQTQKADAQANSNNKAPLTNGANDAAQP